MSTAAESHALLTQSHAIREVFAHGATRGIGGVEHLTGLLAADSDLSVLDVEWLAKLARICALQDSIPGDSEFALKALRYANRRLPMTAANRRFHQLEVELLAERGDFEEGLQRVRENEHLSDLSYGYLDVDLRNPFKWQDAPLNAWLDGFNEPLRRWGLRPVTVTHGSGKPFDRLGTEPFQGPYPIGPKVSVVMTSYQPERDAFLLSARSILQQSWSNLELIIVDDATPGDFTEVLDEVQSEDPRVRVIRLDENGGTYMARNSGMAAATGEFITGQDADDWSHPERLLTQVRYLQENSDRPGVVTSAIRTDEDLVRIRRGQNPGRRCEVSFMLRSEIAKQVGGYLPARKAADSEFRQRVSRFAGRDVGELGEPLYFIRLLANSLSRGDFRPGWSHPTRRAFWNACTYWHNNAKAHELTLDSLQDPMELPVPIPGRFRIREPEAREFDFVFAADFREYAGRQRSIIDEAKALAYRGFRIGFFQIESLRFRASGARALCEPVQALINSGTVEHVVQSEGAQVKVLVLRDPAALQFPPAGRADLDGEALLIVGDESSANSDGTDIQYLPTDIQANAEQYFGLSGQWVPGGPVTRRSLIREGLPAEMLRDTCWTRVIRPEEWNVPRDGWRSYLPVVGRHSENSEVFWPRESEEISQMWPANGSQDIRILGDARSALRVCGWRYYPSSWLVFGRGQISPRAFYASVDFYVYFTDATWPEDGVREIIEAMAAGCVVILPTKQASLYGDAAIYAHPDEVVGLVTELRQDWERFSKQSLVGRRFAARHYAGGDRVNELMSVLLRAVVPSKNIGEQE